VLNLPQDLPIVDAVLTSRQYRRGELPEPVPYDPDSAGRLLDAAGWRDADGDGVRERGAQRFRFVALAPGGLVEGRAPVFVQEQLRRIGIRMDVQMMEDELIGSRLRAGEFDAAFHRIWNTIGKWLGEGSPIGYRNPRVVALLRAARATGDPDEIDRIYRELMPVLRADLPVTLLFPVVQTVVAHRRVRGLQSPFQADPFMRMEHLWLEEP
jgi:peptide/nickel transport system substrate-binding protein